MQILLTSKNIKLSNQFREALHKSRDCFRLFFSSFISNTEPLDARGSSVYLTVKFKTRSCSIFEKEADKTSDSFFIFVEMTMTRYKIFQYDLEPVLIQRILNGFESILEILFNLPCDDVSSCLILLALKDSNPVPNLENPSSLEKYIFSF